MTEFSKKSLKIKKWYFKNGVKNIQAKIYNGSHTVDYLPWK
jgi:hypothetical protein